jgi:cell division protein FtsW
MPYRTEPILSVLLTAFLVFGLFMVYSTTSILSFERYGSDTYFVSRHIIHLSIGLCVAFLFTRIKLSWLQQHAYVIFGLSFLLLLLTFIPGVGTTLGGAKRWLMIGGVSIQPSEFFKVAFLLFLATSICKKIERQTLQFFSIGIIPHVFITALLCIILVKQPDFGNAVVYLTLMVFLLYIAGAKFSHLLIMVLAIAPIAVYEVTRSPYRLKRVLTFLNPWADPMNQGFQIIQSLFSFSSGEIFGKGLGNSQGKLFFVPESHSDFVFAIMGEELGFIGIFVILFLWCSFLARGFKIARECKDTFSYLVASGSVFLLTLQSLIHMMVNLSLLPAKGMNMPFISTGGSNLILCLILTGLLLNCAAQNKPIPSPQ